MSDVPASASSDSLSIRKQVGKFTIGKIVGKGNFSKVRAAVDTTSGEKVAIKIIDKGSSFLVGKGDLEEEIRREISILKVLKHKNIVQMKEAFQTTKHMYVVMELVEGGELFDVVADQGRLTEDVARKYFQQLVVATRCCHRYNIAHRDLKLESLLLDTKGNLKISDFGLANIKANAEASIPRNRAPNYRTVCGTPNYVAPEVIKNARGGTQAASSPGGSEPTTGYNNFLADIWSCGIILFIMLSGRQPFDDDDLQSLFNKIERGQYQMSRHIPEGAKSLIDKMLQVDPLKRITIDQIIAHPWFQKGFDPADLEATSVVLPDEKQVKNAVTDVNEGESMRNSSVLSAGRGVDAPALSPAMSSAPSSAAQSPGEAVSSSSGSPVQSATSGSAGGLDGFQLSFNLLSNALISPQFVDIPPAIGSVRGSNTNNNNAAVPTTSDAPIFGGIRQFLVKGNVSEVHAAASLWVKSILPSAVRGGISNVQEQIRGFSTTPRGIMTFLMDVQPISCVQNVCLVTAKKGTGDCKDFLETLKGFGKRLAEQKVLLSVPSSSTSAASSSGSSNNNKKRSPPGQGKHEDKKRNSDSDQEVYDKTRNSDSDQEETNRQPKSASAAAASSSDNSNNKSSPPGQGKHEDKKRNSDSDQEVHDKEKKDDSDQETYDKA